MADKIIDFLNATARDLSSKKLSVGFIDGATYPDGTSVAAVAIQNEYGDPAKRIPARPFFRNAISANQDKWSEELGKGIRAGVPVSQVLEVLGAVIASDVRESIYQLTEPELSPYTIKKRQERGNDSTKPLEDTKKMVNSITYAITDASEGGE